jgi:hypothetical protein
LTGVVKGCCRALKILGTGKANKPIPQILSLNENEYNENNDNPGRRQWMD